MILMYQSMCTATTATMMIEKHSKAQYNFNFCYGFLLCYAMPTIVTLYRIYIGYTLPSECRNVIYMMLYVYILEEYLAVQSI